eukprot:CAMPEP_0194366088 /NCGR_PEP_ID=MMETSP0174-20130528/14093_1 /TAXON_ID=216777 /ORGANISM="Proboscia alata, Strain PI-D3" /LENGTH=1061 /DNA_ID=CAMNT_0039141071 /DNA_START=269 /DNA_END=3454 /DNA_ORIENTATION=-
MMFITTTTHKTFISTRQLRICDKSLLYSSFVESTEGLSKEQLTNNLEKSVFSEDDDVILPKLSDILQTFGGFGDESSEIVVTKKVYDDSSGTGIPSTTIKKLSDVLQLYSSDNESSSSNKKHFNNKSKKNGKVNNKLPPSPMASFSPPPSRITNSNSASVDSLSLIATKPPRESSLPWKASYMQSRRTNAIFQSIAHDTSLSKAQRSHSILQTLVELPPENCNQVNLVCAFTTSAKLCPLLPLKSHWSASSKGVFEQTVNIVRTLISAQHGVKWKGRQLANLVWALVKHGWPQGMENDKLEDAQLMKDIALQLVLLDGNEQKMSVGEMSMSLWAFASQMPNDKPTGWSHPRRNVETRSISTSSTSEIDNSGDDDDIEDMEVSFREDKDWNDFWHDYDEEDEFEVIFVRGKRRIVRKPPQQQQLLSKHEQEVSYQQEIQSDRQGSQKQYKKSNSHLQMTEIKSSIDTLFEHCAASLNSNNASPNHNHEKEATAVSYSPSVFSTMDWHEMANIAWSYATKLHITTESQILMTNLVDEALHRMEMQKRQQSNRVNNNIIKSRDVSILAWSVSVMSVSNYRLGDVLERLIIGIAEYYYPQGNGVKEEEYDTRNSPSLPSLSLTKNNNSFNTQWKAKDVVQTLIAMSYGRIDHTNLLAQLFQQALVICQKQQQQSSGDYFQTWELSVLLWVQAKLHLTESIHPVFMEFTVEAIELLASTISVKDTGTTAIRSFESDTSNNDNNEFKGKHRQQQKRVMSNLGAQEMANLPWSLTVLLPNLEHYISTSETAAATATNDITSFETRARARKVIANVNTLFTNIFQQTLAQFERDPESLTPEHAHQLWQAYSLLLQHDKENNNNNVNTNNNNYSSMVSSPQELLSPQFLAHLQNMWNREKNRQKVSSMRHKSLSETLNLMRIKHYNEHDEDIDVAIVLRADSGWTHTAEFGECDDDLDCSAYHVNGGGYNSNSGNVHQKLAVEFDGPDHFTRNGRRALGHTVLKYRLLKMQGWTVVRVPYYEFDKIPFWASMERQRYLQRLLKTHPNLSFSQADVSEYKKIVPNRKSRFD